MRKTYGMIFVIFAFFLFNSLVVISEGERGIVLRFGKIQRTDSGNVKVYSPGLHFKLPFLDSVRTLDSRLQMLDSSEDRFVSVEKKDLLVDSYVQWRVSDFGKFYTATGGGDYSKAADLLKRKVSDRLRSEIGSRTVKDIVSGSRGELMAGAQKALNAGNDGAEKLGIQVVDVRVKQINLPNEVSASIYSRMRAERDAVAKEHRSQGEEKAEVIRAEADSKVVVILANANRTADMLRGEGDAQAAKLYADAFAGEPDFYRFVRSLKAYETSFADGKNNLMVLSPEGDFFRYLKSTK